jgi:hypothetical protein
MGAADVARLAWQLRAARWGGRGGAGALHPDLGGYAERPLPQVHDTLVRCLRDLDGVLRPKRLAVFEAFFGVSGPPSDAQALAQQFALTPDGVRRAIHAVELLLAKGLPRKPGKAPAQLRPSVFQPHGANALPAITAAMAEAVGDQVTVAALGELRVQAEPGWLPSKEGLSALSRMGRLRARRRAACLAGYHQQRIDVSRALRTLVPTPRRLGALEQDGTLEPLLAEYAHVLPADYETAVCELTRKSGPNPELVTAIATAANEALIVTEQDVEPLLSVIAGQFARSRSDVKGSRVLALALVQAVRAAQAREMEDLSALHYADSVLRIVGPVHPLGQQALRDAALTLRAHYFFSAAAACLQNSGAVARSLPKSFARDVAVGQHFSHRAGLALSVGRAHASRGRPRPPTDLADLLYGTMATADQILQHDPDGGSIGLVATLRRRAAELAFTWPNAPESRRIRSRVFEWADEFRNATVRLGQLQWCRSAMVVALQMRDEEEFARWDKRAEGLSQGPSKHFTALQEIAHLRMRAEQLGLKAASDPQRPSGLIAASASDLARLARYTARPERSGSGLLLVT